MTLRPGEVLQTAIWMDGKETVEQKRMFERDIRASLASLADFAGIIIGPLILTEKRPGDDRVPEVPNHIQGPDVRLLVAKATVMGHPYGHDSSAFVADLDVKDLARLRAILRRVHGAYNPGKPELTTEKCDEYINANGPDAALAALREQVGVQVN